MIAFFQEWERTGFFKALWQAGLSEYDELQGIAARQIGLPSFTPGCYNQEQAYLIICRYGSGWGTHLC
jgi:hypothetical protein